MWCWITPYLPSRSTSTVIATPSRTAVSSSCEFIRKPPSPLTATTRRSGRASFAATAPGSAMPMAAKPLEMMQVLGRSAWNRRATHNLCAPTSHTSTSSSAIARRRSAITRCGFSGKAGSSALCWTAWTRLECSRLPAPSGLVLARSEMRLKASPMSPTMPAASM